MKNLLLILMIGTVHSFNITRGDKKDILRCNNDKINCSRSSSYQMGKSTCECMGTFVKIGDRVECIKDTAVTSECRFMFDNSNAHIQAVSLEKPPGYNEFTNGIVSSNKTKCVSMKLNAVKYLNNDFEWVSTPSKDFSLQTPSTGRILIRWINSFNVNSSFYSGQLLKFMLRCKRSYFAKAEQVCLYGKFIGTRTWETKNSDLCHQGKKTNETSTNITSSKISPRSGNVAIIGGSVAACFVILVVVIVVLICLKKRKVQKENKSEETIELSTKTSRNNHDYVEPNGLDEYHIYDDYDSSKVQTDFENKTYLASIKSQGNNNTYENVRNQQQENIPVLLPKSVKQQKTSSLAKPVVSANSSNMYEPIYTVYEDPDEVKNSSYTTLSEIDSKQQHYDTLEDTYMDMSRKNKDSEPIYD